MRIHAAPLALLFLASACRTPGAKVRSSMGATSFPPAASWVDLNRDEYIHLVLAAEPSEPAQLLPAENPLTARSQFWLDLIDHRLRQLYPQLLKPVPSPKAAVLAGFTANAVTAPARVCMPVAVRLRESTATTPDAGYLGMTLEGDDAVLGEVTSCKEVPYKANPSLLAAPSTPACGVYAVPRPAPQPPLLQLKMPCPALSPVLADKTLAKGLMAESVSNWITISADVLSGLSKEPEYVALLAHELGHYYRAHASDGGRPGYFFYRIGDDSFAKRPVPDPDLAGLGAQMVAASKRLEQEDGAIDDAGYTRALADYFYFIGTVIKDEGLCGANASCKTACSNFAALAKPSDDRRVAVATFDRAFMTCTKLVPLVRDPSKPVYAQPPLSLVRYTLQDIGGAEAVAGAAAAPGQSWGGLLQAVNQWYLNLRQADQTILSTAAAEDLAYATAEQEADVLSVEFLAMIGIDPAAATKRYLDLLVTEARGGKKDDAFYAPDQASCRAMQARGWKDAAGNEVVIPLGDYGEPHHNDCYRAWAVDREVERFSVGDPPPKPPGPTWSELVKAAAAAGQSAARTACST